MCRPVCVPPPPLPELFGFSWPGRILQTPGQRRTCLCVGDMILHVVPVVAAQKCIDELQVIRRQTRMASCAQKRSGHRICSHMGDLPGAGRLSTFPRTSTLTILVARLGRRRLWLLSVPETRRAKCGPVGCPSTLAPLQRGGVPVPGVCPCCRELAAIRERTS